MQKGDGLMYTYRRSGGQERDSAIVDYYDVNESIKNQRFHCWCLSGKNEEKIMKKSLLSVVLASAMTAAVLSGCGSSDTSAESSAAQSVSSVSDAAAEETSGASAAVSGDSETSAADSVVSASSGQASSEADGAFTDPAGNEITLPDEVNSIVSMAPSNTRILIDLGLADKITACDTYSEMYYGDQLTEDIPTFDMMQPDQEQIAALNPDLVLTTGMSYSQGDDVYASVREAGVCVADIPTAETLAEIGSDIEFIGKCTGEEEKAENIVSEMNDCINKMKELGSTIDVGPLKSVLLVTSTPTADYPTIYAAGSDTYIDEIITDLSCINAAATDSGEQWPALTEEAAVSLNPDVIISTDTYTENVVDTWLSMEGWENVNAIKNKEVYLLKYSNELNQPNQHVVSAMVEMAKDIYPDVYKDLEDPFDGTASESEEN